MGLATPLDVARLRAMCTDHPMPEGLEVALVTAETLWNARDLPYDSPTSMAFGAGGQPRAPPPALALCRVARWRAGWTKCALCDHW